MLVLSDVYNQKWGLCKKPSAQLKLTFSFNVNDLSEDMSGHV